MTGETSFEPPADDLLVDVGENGVARLTLNRAERLNALTAPHFRQLTAVIHQLGWRPDVRVVVITGAGRAFCAGGDVKTLTRDVVVASGHVALEALLALRRCPKPVVAMVNGDAVGGGNEIVIACDLAIAAESARLGQAGTRLGWAPVIDGTNFLGMVVGDKRAREISFLSKIVPASVALEWGWVNEVVPDDELQATTDRWCEELVARSPGGLRLAKATANFWWDLTYASMASGMAMMDAGLTDETVQEGVAAFLARRRPEWPER